MTTLLVAGRSRCTESCWDAEGPECKCVCEGVFHGVGRQRALAQALLELPGGDVVVLPELPLQVVQDMQADQHRGRRCARCGGTVGLRTYVEGLVCRSCREASLVLVEEEGG